MADSSGSFPAFPRPRFKWRRRALGWLAAGLAATAGLAQMPPYLRAALNGFAAQVPPGWGYTLMTDRNGQTMVERFDPSRPPGGQWTLLQWTGRNPTAEELEKYIQSRPTADAGGGQANFQKNDIEPGSLHLVHEDEDRAEYLGGFREESSGADKMLRHLRLRLTVRKRQAYIEKYTLELAEPYSPVFGVKMNRLRVEATFAAPAADRPALPIDQQSHFTGRLLLVPTEEKLQLSYRDFQRAR